MATLNGPEKVCERTFKSSVCERGTGTGPGPTRDWDFRGHSVRTAKEAVPAEAIVESPPPPQLLYASIQHPSSNSAPEIIKRKTLRAHVI